MQDGSGNYFLIFRTQSPGFLLHIGALGAVAAHNGQEGAELHPAGIEFAVEHVAIMDKHVSAQVVAPITVAYVRSGAIEVRLVVERSPGGVGVAREAYLIAMVAQTTPTMVEHGTMFGLRAKLVVEDAVVEPPCVAERWDAIVLQLLLPIEPPEIHTLLLEREKHLVEPTAHEALVGTLPTDGLGALGITSEEFGQLGILVLVSRYTIGRMEVEGDLQVMLLEEREELLGAGEEAVVPRVTRPSSEARFGPVPVHIDHEHVERDAIAFEVAHHLSHLAIGITPIAAPPVAETITWRQRDASSQQRKVTKYLLVVMTICHEVPVGGFLLRVTGCCWALLHPREFGGSEVVDIAIEEQALRIVDEGPAVTCQQTILERQWLTLSWLVMLPRIVAVAVVAIEGAIGAS